MRKIFSFAVIMICGINAFAQFTPDNLQIRLGYNFHNAPAKNFNHLITTFNNERYPSIIEENLRSINFLHGILFGATYTFSEDFYFHLVFKNRWQFSEAKYLASSMYRKYFFRANSLEAGLTVPIGQEKRVRHLVGGGLVLGLLSSYTDWKENEGYPGARKMFSIAHSEILGLSLHYEAQIILHDNFRIFIRPVAQYALNSNLRNLNQFFNPQPDGNEVSFPEGEGKKYDKGNLNGIGIEGGLLILLPEF